MDWLPICLYLFTLSLVRAAPLANASAPSPSGGGGKCPPGFRGTVFNTAAVTNAGWPQNTWNSISSNGISDWVGFALDTVDKTPIYNTATGPSATTPQLNAAQLHQLVDPTQIQAAVQLLQDDPPAYMVLLNEPDYSFGGFTPLTSATDAANDLKPIFAAAHPKTTFLSPALAFSNSDWLTTFRDACGGCMSQIPIITMHVYDTDPAALLVRIGQLHATWPDKRIWITEIGPATSGACTMDEAGMIGWMNTVVPQIAALGYVDKIFWNNGEYSSNPTCKTSLTNDDGSATNLLKAYGAIC